MSDYMLISKVVTLLVNKATFNRDIREWSKMNKNKKTCEDSKIFLQQARCKIHKTVTTSIT